MPFCTVVHAIMPVKAAWGSVLGLGWGCGRVVIILHCIYSIHALTSHIYICSMSSFYLHTRLELCTLFFNITELFLSM